MSDSEQPYAFYAMSPTVEVIRGEDGMLHTYVDGVEAGDEVTDAYLDALGFAGQMIRDGELG
jgi:hypothetical protein